jgi:hypothetical protein
VQQQLHPQCKEAKMKLLTDEIRETLLANGRAMAKRLGRIDA